MTTSPFQAVRLSFVRPPGQQGSIFPFGPTREGTAAGEKLKVFGNEERILWSRRSRWFGARPTGDGERARKPPTWVGQGNGFIAFFE
jgi:hypothetical protein